MAVEIIESSSPTKPGFYRMPHEIYHRDPLPQPSLSSSIVKTLHVKSPRHAWFEHPRLNPDYSDEATPQQQAARDFGSAVHKQVLGYGDQIEIVRAKDWRTDAAKEARAKAWLGHRIPLLELDFQEVEAASIPLRLAIEDYLGIPMEDALREVVLVWKESGLWRRAMIDYMHPDLKRLGDAKTTATSCAPGIVSKFIYTQGYHVSAAHYLRGLDALDPDNAGRREFAFQFAEKKNPYITSPVMLVSEAGLHLGRKICESGAFTWNACLKAGMGPEHWPAYDVGPVTAEPPAWLLTNTMAEWETE